MRRGALLVALLGPWALCFMPVIADKGEPKYFPSPLPKPGTVHIDKERGEVVLSAKVQHPKGKPCIDDWGKRWVERPYQDFAMERVMVDGKPVEKPWTPSFVFHGSGAIHRSGTGCIACPCDCAGGIIADNRFPLYNPKPIVRFDLNKVPKA